MPPKITRVRWSASSIPWGMSFNEQTGTFSGTPDDVGEYIVPVTVETNYGKDTKDVFINVLKSYSVYAIGGHAAQWSENAEPDEYGFRQLAIPETIRLSNLTYGFGAKTKNGKWYIASMQSSFYFGDVEINFLTPKAYPIENINEMTMGVCAATNVSYSIFAYRVLNTLYIYRYKNTSSGQTHEKYIVDDIRKLQNQSCSGLIAIKKDDSIYINSSVGNCEYIIHNFEKSIKNVAVYSLYGRDTYCFLTYDGELYAHFGNSLNPQEIERIGAEIGKIKNFYSNYYGYSFSSNSVNGTLFMQNENNDIYETEKNSPKTLIRIGNFDVKKIEISSDNNVFMLTNDGKLYRKGSVISGITDEHSEFTQIFPACHFYDMTFIGDTLLVLKE